MIAILHPYILHYREAFFEGLGERFDTRIFCYERDEKIADRSLKKANVEVENIWSVTVGPFLFYNPFPLLQKDTEVVVLMLNFSHLTSWLVLLTKFLHKKKIMIWGHGISVKRYVREEKHPSRLLACMLHLSDGIWFYTQKEKEMWQELMPQKSTIALNNTVSDADWLVELPQADKRSLKAELGIGEEVILLFCARFNIEERKIGLLEAAVSSLDPQKFGFVIIGDGPLKPDFAPFGNVYDFGALYDREVKNKLFSLADIYYQPGWVGLSIVEAMAYGLPIYTFKRTASHLQCVEYSYIIDGHNGRIFGGFGDFLEAMRQIDPDDIARLGKNARAYVAENLRMSSMIGSAVTHLKLVQSL